MEKLKLHIQNPCHKTLDSSKDHKDGKFCGHCSQVVIDFTQFTNAEFIAFFAAKANTKDLCVQMREDQLQNGIPLTNRSFKFPAIVRKFASISLVGFSLAGSPILLNGQNQTEATEEELTNPILQEQQFITIEIPAEYDTVSVKKLIIPAKVIVEDIPAEYQTISKRELVHKGGLVEWREITCVVPESHITVEIKSLKEALAKKGYFEGEIDNIITDDLQNALIKFKEEHGQTPSFELDDNTSYLLGLSTQ